MRSIIFCKRTVKEILRDPISYIFCIAFPLLMLVIMSIVNQSIPAEANMSSFQIQNLGPGIAFFGLTFVMLFICIQVSKDRSTAFIMRMQASPMKSYDFIFGYTISVSFIALIQMVVTFLASFVIAGVFGGSLSVPGSLCSILCLIPSALMFIALGMIFGTLVNEKAAPGICSIIISAVGMIGGIWMDVDALGGIMLDVSKALPFYHGVRLGRLALQGKTEEILQPLLPVLIWTVIFFALAIFVMNRKLKKDTY